MIINNYGNKEWRNSDGELHREDGPAYIGTSGHKAWYINGQKHRENGPAVEFVDEFKAWYLNDIEYSEEEYKRKMRRKKISSLLNK